MTRYLQDYMVTRDGAPIWWELRGDGPQTPAVFFDGLGCDGFVWKHLWGQLTPDRPVLHSHYRGHGQSGVATDPTRIGVDYIIDDVAALMDKVGIGEAVLFGHSMGVQVCLEFHRRYPQRVKGLALLCGSYGNPLDTWHDHSLLRLGFPLMLGTVEKYPSLAHSIMKRVMKTEVAMEVAIRTELSKELLPREDFYPYMDHLARMHPLNFVRTLNSLKDHSAIDHLPDVRVPSLVVGGEIDRFTPVWLSERMAAALPMSEYVFVKGGSHTAPLERPDQVAAAVDRLLDRAGRTPQSKTA